MRRTLPGILPKAENIDFFARCDSKSRKINRWDFIKVKYFCKARKSKQQGVFAIYDK